MPRKPSKKSKSKSKSKSNNDDSNVANNNPEQNNENIVNVKDEIINNDAAGPVADLDNTNEEENDVDNNNNENNNDNDIDVDEDDDEDVDENANASANEDENDDNDNENDNESEAIVTTKDAAPRGRGRPSGKGGKRKRAKGDNRYRVYIFKVLQQVHPKVGITKTAMDIVNSFIEDMFDQICNEAMKLCQYHKTSTIGAREIASASRLILPGELRKHAILEGEKAVKTFEQNSKDLKARRKILRGDVKGVFRGKRKN